MITVGIPVYNQVEYLADAIDSVLMQTAKCEIIVCDDGSTDGSGAIADSYKDKGVKVIHQVNKGLASARNTLIMNMTGDYFLPLDADDILKENCVERMLIVINNSQADIIAPSFKCFGTTSNTVTIGQFTLEELRSANRLGYFSAIKKEALLEIGGYSPKMTWGYEDWHLWIDLLTRGKSLAIIQEPLVLYRTKEKSMITEANAHSEELIAQINKDFKYE